MSGREWSQVFSIGEFDKLKDNFEGSTCNIYGSSR